MWLRRALSAAVVAKTLAVATGLAHATPVLRVRTQSRIELALRAEGPRITVTGTVRDDLGTPLPGRTLQIGYAAIATEGLPTMLGVQTGDDCTFELSIERPSTSVRIAARYSGDAYVDATEASQTFDVARAAVALDLVSVSGSQLDLGRAEHEFRVTAHAPTTQPGPSGLAGQAVELRDEVDRPLATGRLDEHGGLVTRVA